MKVVFIQPPSSLLLEDKVMPPLGILYLAAWLRKYQHQPEIIDLAGVSDWHQKLRDERYKIEESHLIGLTATTPQYPVSQAIAQDIRALGFRQPIAVGGIHVTSLVHANEMDFLKDPFDSFVIGEGYNAVTKMCADIETGTLKKTYAEPIIKDVNELPFAARDLIDIRGYKYKLGDTQATTQYTQYGCPYACLSADTLISLYNGGYIRLDEIRIGDYILNTEGRKSIVMARQQTSKKETYEVELQSGEKITGSADHPVLTKRGWVKIANLEETDEVLISSFVKYAKNHSDDGMIIQTKNTAQ